MPRLEARHFFAVDPTERCALCSKPIEKNQICVGSLDSDDVVHLDCYAELSEQEAN